MPGKGARRTRLGWDIGKRPVAVSYTHLDVYKRQGMDVIFVTTAKTDEEARELLKQFNMPFAK